VAKYCDEYVCVCLSVCPRGYLWNHVCDLYQISCACCLWPWLSPSAASLQNPKGKGNFGGFLPHWHFTVLHGIWDSYKNGWTDWDAVWDDEWAWPEELCYRTLCGGDNLWRWRGNFEENICPASLTPLIIANWTGSCSGTRLAALDESIIGHESDGAIAQHGRSLISTTALFVCCKWKSWIIVINFVQD